MNFTNNVDLEMFAKEATNQPKFFDLEAVKKKLAGEDYKVTYLHLDSQIVGGCLWYKKNLKQAHIYLIFIKNQYQHKGYGREVLKHVLKDIDDENIKETTVCINNNNNKTIKLFLGESFRILSVILNKGAFMLIKAKEEEVQMIQNLLFEDDIFKKMDILENILLNNYTSLNLLGKDDLLDINNMNNKNKFRYLKILSDSDKGEGVEALGKLSRYIDEINEIYPIVDRLKILKYIAIHAEKQYSEKAIETLYRNMKNILELKNEELKASYLRYLLLHVRDQLKEEVLLKNFNLINNEKVKETSYDYVSIMNKNG